MESGEKEFQMLVSVSKCSKCGRGMGERHKAIGKRPSIATMTRWSDNGIAKATDGCRVDLDGTCSHGHASWVLSLGLI